MRRNGVEVLVVISVKIDDAFVSKALNQMPGFCVQGDHAIPRVDINDALIRAVSARPPRQTSPSALARSELASLTFIHLVCPKDLMAFTISGVEEKSRSGVGPKLFVFSRQAISSLSKLSLLIWSSGE